MNNNHDDSTNYYYFMSPPPSLASKSSSLSLNTIIIALIVLFFVLAFCFFLSLYAKWYWSTHEDPFIVSWRGRVARQVAPAAPAVTRRRGLDRVTLRALPLVVYDPKDFKEGLECSVCLSEISLGEKVRLLPKCNHGFHVECIDMWFKSHSTCPLCRNSVSAFENQSITNDSSGPELHDDNSETDQSSDSDSNSDSDSDSDHEGGSRRGSVTLSFPTNVLYWGDEVQVRSLVGETTNDNNNVASSSSNNNNNNDNRQRDELVIEIPSDLCEDCFSTPRSSGRFREEEVKTPKTPVVSRLRSLRRLLSKGKSLAPWASSSNSTSTIENVEQV